jgi:hypothetical protein
MGAIKLAGICSDRARFAGKSSKILPTTPETLVNKRVRLTQGGFFAFRKIAALHRTALGMSDGQASLGDVFLHEFPRAENLGDFRLLREIGRGGMGVVYEAEQLSLGRRVALKVLPFAAVLDPRQLRRFKSEAQAAALLKHPHIVSVYSVGCERAVHFYAMERVDGWSLAEVIEHLRSRAIKREKVASRALARGIGPVPHSDPTFPRTLCPG